MQDPAKPRMSRERNISAFFDDMEELVTNRYVLVNIENRTKTSRRITVSRLGQMSVEGWSFISLF